ncbi:MAG TPA: HlyD family type I secretion periplasmic adaptor subunit [Micropepsaceae bacterium]|nr:HlyD family type I secretion periplasmic adaptor subunit [Micropepsaceae bacterium]
MSTMQESRTLIVAKGRELTASGQLPAVYDTELSDSPRRYAILGSIILLLFFGVLGTWAAIAPLNGAVVSQAVVKVEGNRKTLQHLDGGIVKQLRVKEGDHVNAGDVIIVLDDTQARAEFNVYSEQHLNLRATEVRLLAELNRAETLSPPADIAERLSNPDVATVWNSQLEQFENRRAALESQHKVIAEKINQLESQIAGGEQQVVAYQEQRNSTQKELDVITPLADKGLITQPRLLQLQRSAFGLTGQIESTKSSIAGLRQNIAEQMQQATKIDSDWMADTAKQLHDTQAQLLEVTPKLANAQAVLGRTTIRSPYTGKVVGLSVFAVGSVIQRGDKILDVVPDNDNLTIEAQIPVDAISDVHPGMAAEVRLTAYKQRITPSVPGKVIQVSADRLTEQRTGMPYYTAVVQIDQKALAVLPQVSLYPGMPANVMIPTVERTALDYLIGPLAMSFNSAFRQR